MVIDPRAATAFTAADDYERGRPGYPVAAVDLVLRELRLGTASTVLDLAAGTGKVARLLHGRVGEVIAVEPGDAMRGQLAARLPEITLLDGTAEDIPIADDTIDGAVVGEAFHWFNVVAAAGEIARVLRPRGGLALLWNVPVWTTRNTPWLAGLQQVLAHHRKAAGVYPAGEGTWQRLLERTGLFDPLTHAHAAHVQRLSPADFLAQISSWSWITNLPEAPRRAALGDVAALVSHQVEIVIPYRVDIYWTRRRGR